jgi:hypothetical protein
MIDDSRERLKDISDTVADALEEAPGGLNEPDSATFFLLALADRLLERGVGAEAVHALFVGTSQIIGGKIAEDAAPSSDMN